MNRTDNLDRARTRPKPWDIVVIGGGATGVGCALDAASRGYDVLLLEQHDFGKGTSSRSTKLIHGGVRYLRQGNFSLVRQALRERQILLGIAPHVVHPQEFIVPCYSVWHRLVYGLGLRLYDLMAGRYSIGRSTILSRSETLKRLRTLDPTGLQGGVLYYDGQFDDTRLLIDIAGTADAHGACLINYACVTSLLKDRKGVTVVEFENVETGERFNVGAKAVINATGAFCDKVRRLSDPTTDNVVTFAEGVHLVLERRFLPADTAIMVPKTKDGRVLFCIPWHKHVLVGTTDTPVDDAILEPEALDSEVDFILETAGPYLATRPTRDDVLSQFAGIRPLLDRTSYKNTASLSRGHKLFVDAAGLITITGGKWTTYRCMAREAVDKACVTAGLERRNCITQTLAITPPETSSGEPLHPDLPYTQEDLLRAIRDEMAINIEDVLARRTRALFLDASAAMKLAPVVATLMAGELGRGDDWVSVQLAEFESLAKKYLPKINRLAS